MIEKDARGDHCEVVETVREREEVDVEEEEIQAKHLKRDQDHAMISDRERWQNPPSAENQTLGKSRMDTRVRRHTTVNISQSQVTTRI
jgi:hypothetical protein